MNSINNGVFPTMLTPFRKDLTIDYPAVSRLIDWYLKTGVNGIFAVCQSSAMFELSLRERVALAGFVIEKTRQISDEQGRGKVSVVCSGHISDTRDDQIEELEAIGETGADAMVLVSNRLSKPFESDSVWMKNTEKLIDRLPDEMLLGLYECPTPYKRVLSDEVIKWLIQTGRFVFIKDTCCDPVQMERRGELVAGTGMKLFNANAPTLLHSLKHGYAGYSGIMTNFHAELYVRLCEGWKQNPEYAERLQNYLASASLFELVGYPQNAKYILNLRGVKMGTESRRGDVAAREITVYDELTLKQFLSLSLEWENDRELIKY